MFRHVQAPLLQACRRRSTVPWTLACRGVTVASTKTSTSNPLSSPPLKSDALAALLDGEPKKPSIITEIPGPKAWAAKEAMGKIQDVSPCQIHDSL